MTTLKSEHFEGTLIGCLELKNDDTQMAKAVCKKDCQILIKRCPDGLKNMKLNISRASINGIWMMPRTLKFLCTDQGQKEVHFSFPRSMNTEEYFVTLDGVNQEGKYVLLYKFLVSLSEDLIHSTIPVNCLPKIINLEIKNSGPKRDIVKVKRHHLELFGCKNIPCLSKIVFPKLELKKNVN